MNRITTVLVLAATAVCMRSVDALGCSIAYGERFSHRHLPDGPLAQFASGQLGILHAEMHAHYLLAAHRWLVGRALTATEQSDLLEFWIRCEADRAHACPEPSDTAGARWDRAREAYAGLRPRGRVDDGDSFEVASAQAHSRYVYFSRVLPDAYETATTSLELLAARHGAKSPEVLEWTTAQDMVFLSTSSRPQIPSPLSGEWPAELKAHRAYQIAAAHFYASHFDEANTLFTAIAGDPKSPWRRVAAYVAARCLVRKATLLADNAAYTPLLVAAEALLSEILSDPAHWETRAAASRLLHFVEVRLRPELRLCAVRRALAGPLTLRTLDDNWSDLLWLVDDGVSPSLPDADSEPYARSDLDDFATWLVRFRSDDPRQLDDALFRWQETKATPWLVVAAMKCRAGNPVCSPITRRALAEPAFSPAYLTLAYHGIRLLIGEGSNDEARLRLDALLALRLPLSSRNRLLELRLSLARDLKELLAAAVLEPVAAIDSGNSFRETPVEVWERCRDASWRPQDVAGTQVLAGAAADALNQLPLDMLATVVDAGGVPEPIKVAIGAAAWARAMRLGREETAHALASRLGVLDERWRRAAGDLLTATAPAERRFAASLAFLRLRGVSDRVVGEFDVEVEYEGRNPGPVVSFLSDEQNRQAQAESRVDCDPTGTWFESVFARVGSHQSDPRVPEALHLVVELSRQRSFFACRDSAMGEHSKRAFQLLHRRYPGNEWTKATPYWYE